MAEQDISSKIDIFSKSKNKEYNSNNSFLYFHIFIVLILTFFVLNSWSFIDYNTSEMTKEYDPVVLSEYIPDGSDAGISDPRCSSYQLKKIFSGYAGMTPDDSALQANLKKFFAECTPNNVPIKMKSSLGPLIRFLRISYPFRQDNRFKNLSATLKDGRKFNAILGLQKTEKPRPLVIFKCGVFCDSNPSASINSMIYQLFDESPFHIMAVGNMTGEDFLIANSSPGLGGFEEGKQLFEIADWLQAKDSPVKNKISSVHVVGASLGGHAALYSSLYGSLNIGAESKTYPISSVIGVCPVVNLKNSMERFYKDDLLSWAAKILATHRLKSQIMMLPILRNYYKLNNGSGKEALMETSMGGFRFYQDWTNKYEWPLAPFQGIKFTDIQQFWYVNNFINYLPQIKLPTMVLHSTNDMIVESNDNSLLIESKIQDIFNNSQSQNQNNMQLPIFTLNMQYGNHCAFGVAQGWNRIGTLYREWIFRNSPEIQKYRKKKTFSLQSPIRLNAFGRWVKYKWFVKPNRNYAELKLIGFNPIGESCYQKDPFEYDESSWDNQEKTFCSVLNYVKVPLTEFSELMDGQKYEVPETEFQAQSLARKINTQSVLLDAKGTEIYSSTRPAAAVQFEYINE